MRAGSGNETALICTDKVWHPCAQSFASNCCVRCIMRCFNDVRQFQTVMGVAQSSVSHLHFNLHIEEVLGPASPRQQVSQGRRVAIALLRERKKPTKQKPQRTAASICGTPAWCAADLKRTEAAPAFYSKSRAILTAARLLCLSKIFDEVFDEKPLTWG